MANTSFPSIAIGFPPKTGAAINEAPGPFSWATAKLTVSGWTVEQSTKILSFRDWPDSTAEESKLCKTESFETWEGYQFSICCPLLGIRYWRREPYHGENYSTARYQFVEARLRDTTQGLQWCAARHGAVRIEQAQGLFGSEVALQIAGHGEAHGPEAVLWTYQYSQLKKELAHGLAMLKYHLPSQFGPLCSSALVLLLTRLVCSC